VWQGDRLANKEQSAEAALGMVLAFLRGRAARVSGGKPAVEFLDEPVGVDLRLRPDGTAVPLGFVWRSRRYRIESWGRESVQDRDGHTWHCTLVQTAGTAGAETWELCQDTETAQWHLARHWAAPDQSV
jgi:hypothetical protein